MRDIIQYPSDILLLKSQPIDKISPTVESIISDMQYYLKNNAAGLAAIQLGEPISLIGVRYGLDVLFLINPEIIKYSEKLSPSVEGCLSINGGRTQFVVNRYKIIKVKALNPQFQVVIYKARDLFGKVLQHEIDHLNGVLINNHQTLSSARTRSLS